MIKIILIFVSIVLYLIITLPILLIEWILGFFFPNFKSKSCQAMVLAGFRLLIVISGVKVIVLGEENVPKDRSVVYIATHRSYFDILLTYVRVPRLTGYIAKKEMSSWPVFSIWMKNLNCLFLDRENIREGVKTILAAVEKVKNGISICIFPEGTRNKINDTFLPFHDGSFKIAEKSGAPVVPITIVNSASAFEDQFPKVRRTTIILHYGEPVYIKDLDKETRKNIGSYFRNIISETYFRDKETYKDQIGSSKIASKQN